MAMWLLVPGAILFLSGPLLAQGRLSPVNTRVISNSSFAPQNTVPFFMPPFIYNPQRDLYEWEIKDHPDYQECYYDETVGQYIGTCNLSLDSPGFSITTPNRIRR